MARNGARKMVVAGAVAIGGTDDRTGHVYVSVLLKDESEAKRFSAAAEKMGYIVSPSGQYQRSIWSLFPRWAEVIGDASNVTTRKAQPAASVDVDSIVSQVTESVMSQLTAVLEANKATTRGRKTASK